MTSQGGLPAVEWWPDYGGDLFYLVLGLGGERIGMDALGLSVQLQEATRTWLMSYEDTKLPVDGAGDPDWIAEGVRLLALARSEMAGRYVVVVTEPWWAEAPADG